MAARVTAFVVIAIVAVTFVAGLIVGAQREDDSGPVDLIVYNARVYTGIPEAQFAEAIAIRGNRIIRVGSNRDVKRLLRRATTVIDAHGGTVTAGFRDGNVDLKAGGLALVAASATAAAAALPDATSPDAAAPDAAPGAAAQPPLQATTRSEVPGPAATNATPRAQTPPAPPAQTTALGSASSPASGATSPSAAGTATALAPAAAAAISAETGDTLDAIQQAIGHANSVGVTSVGVTARTPDDLLPYDTLLRTRELTARVNAALMAEWPLDEAAVTRLDALRRRYEGVPLFKLKAVRLAVTYQPAPEPRKPAKPLSDEKRQAFYDARVKALSESIALLEQHDWQVILEAPDFEGAMFALHAVRISSLPMTPGARVGRTPERLVRLEAPHFPTSPTPPTPLSTINVMPAMRKPSPDDTWHLVLNPDAEPLDAATRASVAKHSTPMTSEEMTLIHERTERPYAAMMRVQPAFTLFSAWPATALDPRVALKQILLDALKLEAAKAEEPKRANTPETPSLAARLARAIDGSTRYAALASGELDQQGTIAKEMLADLVIFSADLFALPPDKLMDAEVTTTIFDGKVIYTRPEPTADTSSQ
jgi:predicted amidohydrolase YtcJ